MSLFSRKGYDKLITTTEKKVGCPCSLVNCNSHFSTDRAQYQGKSSMFSMYAYTMRALMTPKIMRSIRMRNAKQGNDGNDHSRPQRPCSFWSAPRIATSGQFQRHSGFEWIYRVLNIWRKNPEISV